MKKFLRLYYNESADLFEISVGEPLNYYAEEVEPGVFIRRCKNTREVKSIRVLNFKKRSKNLKHRGIDLPIKMIVEN